jgi:hypothetical protein
MTELVNSLLVLVALTQKHVTSIQQQQSMMDHVLFPDVWILQPAIMIQQQGVMMDLVNLLHAAVQVTLTAQE